MRRKTLTLYKKLGILFVTIALTLSISSLVWGDGGGGGGRRSMGFFDVLLLPRVWIAAIFCMLGVVLLTKPWVKRGIRLLIIATVFFSFGVLPALPLGKFASGMGLHPSPVCSITKPFLFLNAGWQIPMIFITIFAFISVFSIIGNKLFCGWACPIGAIQEIFHHIPLPKRFKKILPFSVSNPIRIIIFIVFMVVVFVAGLSIYDYFNPFHFLHWRFGFMSTVVILITLSASMFFFRPFCYTICPIGLYTWVLEHFSLLKVKVSNSACKDCNLCIKKSSCPTVQSILDEKISRPDCFACGRCMDICPERALRFVR